MLPRPRSSRPGFRSVPLALAVGALSATAAVAAETAVAARSLLLPDRVFDGTTDVRAHRLGGAGRGRADRGGRAARPRSPRAPRTPRVIELPGATLLPGLIDGHAHVLLHPYDETAGTTRC